jgi:hypothetical protein
MTNEINYLGASGLTLSYDIVDGGSVRLASQSLTERGTTGHYYGTISGLAAGDYTVFIKNGSTILGAGTLHWDGSKERINNLDEAISSRSSQTSVSNIRSNILLNTDARLANLDATISSRSTQVSVNAIPVNPVLTTDGRLNNLDTRISSRASESTARAIPTNPVLATDARLNNLDAAVSTRLSTAGYTAPDNAGVTSLNSKLTTGRANNLDNLDAAVSTRLSTAGYTAPDNAGVTSLNSKLTTGRANNLDNLDAAVSSRLSTAGYTAPDNAGVTSLNSKLTTGRANNLDNLDATISSRSTQVSVNAIPVNPVLTTDGRLNNLDTRISSRASESTARAIPTNPVLATDSRLNNLDAAVSSRLSTAGYTAPDNAGVTSLNSKLTTGRANNLDKLDATISSRSTFDNEAELVELANDTVLAIAVAVESRLLNEADGGAIIAAIADAVDTIVFDASNMPITEIVDAVWNRLDSDFSIPNSIGKRIKDNLNATISSRLASASYTAPDNAGIGTANSKIDALNDFDPNNDSVIVRDFTTGAIDADAVGASAVSELQAGLARITDIDALNDLSASDIQAQLTSFGTAKESSVLARPTNPLLTNDSRLNNLDATVSSRSTFNQAVQTVKADIVAVQATAVTNINDFKTTALDIDLNDFADAVAVQLEDPQGLLKKASDQAAIAALNTQK